MGGKGVSDSNATGGFESVTPYPRVGQILQYPILRPEPRLFLATCGRSFIAEQRTGCQTVHERDCSQYRKADGNDRMHAEHISQCQGVVFKPSTVNSKPTRHQGMRSTSDLLSCFSVVDVRCGAFRSSRISGSLITDILA